jgi:hypothetical protein
VRRLNLASGSTPWVCAGVFLLVIVVQQLSRRVVDPIDALRLWRFARDFDAAAERKDPGQLSALFGADAEHFGLTTGRLVQGRDALRRLFQDEFSGEAGADEVDTEIVAFRFLTPEVLLADTTTMYRHYRLDDRFWPVFREHTMVVLVKHNSSWHIAATSAGGHDASQ